MAKYRITPSSKAIIQLPISIGHKAEKGVEAIEFDLTAWVETYGSGTLTVIMRRWGDAIPYPIALEIDENNKATWTLSDIDTAKAGMAYAQLSYVVGETVVKKSDIYTFRVMDSLTDEGEPPEAYESWLEHLTHLAAEAMAEVLDIEGVVTDKTLTVDGGIADAKTVGDALALKADKSTTYTKTEVDALIDEVEVETDTTLEIAGAPADAKKTGDELTAIKADLPYINNDAEIITGWNDGKYINTSGSTCNPTSPIGNASFRYVVVNCTDGDLFTINGQGGSIPKLWAFVDSSNNILLKATTNDKQKNITIVAPTNSSKLIINDKLKDTLCFKGKSLSAQTQELDTGVLHLQNNTRISDDVIPFQMGAFSPNTSTGVITYSSSTTRVSTIESCPLRLQAGDVIGLSDYSNARYFVAWYKPNGGVGQYNGWLTHDYVITEEGDYVVMIGNLTDTVQSDPHDLADLFRYKKSVTVKETKSYIDKKTNALGTQNIIKETGSCIINDAISVESVDIIGATSAVISGLQLFEPVYGGVSSFNGVSVSNNGDGTFTVDGTPTGTYWFFLNQKERTGKSNLLSLNGYYTISAEIISGSATSCIFAIYDSTNNVILGYSSLDNLVNGVFINNNSHCVIGVQLSKDAVYTNFRFRLMVTRTVKPIPWTPYKKPITVISFENLAEIAVEYTPSFAIVTTPLTATIQTLIVGKNNINNDDYIYGFERLPITNHGYYVDVSGTTANINSLVANGAYNCTVIPVEFGDKYTVNAAGGSAPRAYAFLDENGRVLDRSETNGNLVDAVLTVPENATTLVINDRSDGSAYRGNTVKNECIDNIGREYMLDGVNMITQKLKSKSSLGNILVFGFNTDQHIKDEGNNQFTNPVLRGLMALSELTQNYPYDFVCLGGDAPDAGSYATTLDLILDECVTVQKPLYNASCPVVPITGNHDAVQNNPNITGAMLFNAHFKRVCNSGFLDGWDNEHTNGYWDSITHKVRVIFLDSTARTGYTISDIEDALTAMVSGIPEGYKMLIISHHPISSALTNSLWANKLGMQEVINPYADRIICCLCGHIHADVSETSDSILYIGTTLAACVADIQGHARTLNTITETAFDNFVVDQANKKIYAFRYGYGSDREFDYDATSETFGEITS